MINRKIKERKTMKKIITTLVLVLTGTLTINTTFAGESLSISEEAQYSKIPVERASDKTKAQGFETYYGEVFAADEVVGVDAQEAKVLDVLKQDQIELKDGGIFYPEEVEFALRERRGGSRVNKLPPVAE